MFYTIREVAVQLRISLSMAYALVSRGELVCYEIGSCKRVHQQDLDAYLAAQRKETTRLPKNVERHF